MSKELRVKWQYYDAERERWFITYAPTPCPEKAADYIYRTTGSRPVTMENLVGGVWDMTRDAFGQEIRPTQAAIT